MKEEKGLRLKTEKIASLVETIIEQRGGKIYDEKGHAWTLCPFHEDTHPSLSINLRTGDFVCKACGEAGSFIKLWQALHNIESREDAVHSLKSLGVLTKDKPIQEAVYLYYEHETGKLLYRKRKLRHPDGSKSFVIEHYDFENDRWVSGKPSGCPPTLYNYEAVQLARDKDGVIFLVEGEKDVETLKNLNYLATTSGGANDWRTELAGEFAGLSVILIPDNDEAGWQWLARVGNDLLPFASEVYWIDLKEEAERLGVKLPKGGDITDLAELLRGDTCEENFDPIKLLETKPFNPQEISEETISETLSNSGFFLSSDDLEGSTDLEFLFDDFLPWGYSVVLTSEPGEGKTFFALALAKEAIKKGVKVIYVDGENSLPYIKELLKTFDLTNNLKRDLYYFARQTTEMAISDTDPTWRAFKTMLKRLKGLGRAFIVIDTLGAMTRGFDPNSDKEMREVLSELKTIRDMGHAVLILHHTQKYASADERMPAGLKYRGSGVIKSDTDGLFYLERQGNTYTLQAGKLRFMGANTLIATMSSTGLVFKSVGVEESKRKREADELLKLIEEGKEYTQKELVEYAGYKLNYSKNKVMTLLRMLEEEGYIAIKRDKQKNKLLISKKERQKEEQEQNDEEIPF